MATFTIASGVICSGDCRYGPMSWFRNDTYIGRSLDLYGEYSEGEVELFRRILKSGDVVVEAGANIGALTIPLSEIVSNLGAYGYQGIVIAYEPQPEYSDLLITNAAAVALCMPVGLGSNYATIQLPAIPLDKIHAPGWTGSIDAECEYKVSQVPLDGSRMPRLDLLKIDVDGMELDILKGAEQTIARCRPFIYLEYDKPAMYPDMLPWLADHDYRLYRHNPRLFNPQNFAGNPINVFGNLVSVMVLAVPLENKMRFPDLERIRIERIAN